MSYSSSFWEHDSFLQPYDVLIVGAGIVGLSSALFYKQAYPEARIAVLERGFLPQGASTRNAGFACVGSIGEHLADLEKESEDKIKQRILRRYRGLERLKSTLGEKAIGYEDCGGYEFFRSGKEFEHISPYIDQFNRWMEELLDEELVYSARDREGYPVIYNRLEGALHPGKMMQALVQKVSQAGVEIKWNCNVAAVSSEGKVTIEKGPHLKAEKVLLAANGFVQHLIPKVDVVPARGFVFITNEIEDMPWKGIFHHDEGYVYFRNVGTRLLIGGARNLDKVGEQTDHFGTNESIKSHLKNFVSDVLRLPDDWKIAHQWSGIMGFTPTKTPVVEQVDDYRYVAAGLSGMGIAIGMDIGADAVELLSEE